MSEPERRAQAAALCHQASAAENRGDAAQALALAQAAHDLVLDDPEPLVALAHLHYWLTGDDEAGLAAAAAALQRRAGPRAALLGRALAQRRARHWAIATRHPEIADLLADPTRPRRPARTVRLRAAQISISMAVGGVERWIVTLLRYLDKARCEPVLVLLKEGGPLLDAARAVGAEVRLVPVIDAADRLDPGAFGDLVALLATCDVAHTHYGGGDTVAYQAALLAHVPVIVETLQWLCSSFARQADALVCPTHAVLDMQVAKERAVLLPLGVDLADFDPATTNTLGLPRPVVGRVSRLVHEKDPATFVQAAALIAQARPDVHFAIAGDGPLRPELEDRAAQLGVDIAFLGTRADVAGVLRGMDVFAYTPLGDSFGLVVAEALAMALPVVCSPAGALRDLVVDGQNGLLVPPQDPAALAAAVLRLLDDPPLCERMGRIGRRWAETRFSAAAIAARHVALYGRLAAAARG
ncbi:MAG: glycosyltransferase [Chloroflexi bacterium]|nr:glycosyltransferase [Chloroflexota bacterium]